MRRVRRRLPGSFVGPSYARRGHGPRLSRTRGNYVGHNKDLGRNFGFSKASPVPPGVGAAPRTRGRSDCTLNGACTNGTAAMIYMYIYKRVDDRRPLDRTYDGRRRRRRRQRWWWWRFSRSREPSSAARLQDLWQRRCWDRVLRGRVRTCLMVGRGRERDRER